MKSTSFVYLASILLLASSALVLAKGHQKPPQEIPASAPKIAPPVMPAINAKGKVRMTHCWTGTPGCAGNTYFVDKTSQKVAIAIYPRNGSWNDALHFILYPGQQISEFVQYNDSYAWAYGEVDVPIGTPRYWMWVP